MRSHTPIPDGRTGPWLRRRHNRTDDRLALAYDGRCECCVEQVIERAMTELEYDRTLNPELASAMRTLLAPDLEDATLPYA